MGVEFLTCECCSKNFPDCGPHVSCECGRDWCSDSCAQADGYRHSINEEETHEEMDCNYCRGEDVDDYELLETALKMLGISRKGLVEMHNKSE